MKYEIFCPPKQPEYNKKRSNKTIVVKELSGTRPKHIVQQEKDAFKTSEQLTEATAQSKN